MKIEFSIRYGVTGIYKDKDHPIIRIYPIPFIRISIGAEAE